MIQLFSRRIRQSRCHNQNADTLRFIVGVGVLGIVSRRGIYAGTTVCIFDSVVACRSGHLVVDCAIERLQTGFTIAFTNPSLIVSLHHGIGHHSRYRGFQPISVIGCQIGTVVVDHIVPHTGVGILVTDHAVEQLGQLADQTFLVLTGRHHVDDVDQCNSIPADASAPEETITFAAIPAMMIQTCCIVIHGICNPADTAVCNIVDLVGCNAGILDFSFFQSIGIFHQEGTGHVNAIQTQLPGCPGGTVHLMPEIVAVLRAQNRLLLQLIIDIINGICIQSVLAGTKEIKHSQCHGNRIHFTALVILGGTAAAEVI